MTLIASAEQKRYSVSILESADSPEELAEVLKEVATKLAEGYVAGYNPSWELVDEEAKR